MFLYAITARLHIDFIGRLMASEILAIIQLSFVNISSVFKKNKALRIITYWVLVLLIAQVVSDIYNNSSVTTSLKGVSVLVFMMASVVFFIAQLTKNTKSIVFYFFGMSVIALFLPDYPYKSINHPQFFKVSIFPILIPLVLATSYYLYKKYHLTTYLFILITFIAFMFDSRSTGLIFLISAVILYLYEIDFRPNPKKTLLSFFILTGIFYSMYALYVHNVISGNISGQSTQQILKLDNPFNPIELLQYGRVDTFVGIKAAMDKPMMGHGYMPIDHNRHYIEIKEKMLRKNINQQSALIPVHSVIIGAWVYAGIIGLVAIISIYSYLIILFYQIYLSRSFDRYMPILIFLVVMMTWNMLFSPYGHLRTTIPIIIALLLALSQQKENSNLS